MASAIAVPEPPIDFHASPEYLALTPKQRAWVDQFVVTRDAVLTTKTVYDFAIDRHAQMFSYTVTKNSRIRAALNRYDGVTEQEAFLAEVYETMHSAPKGSDRQVRAQALYARLKYDIKPEVSDPEPEAASSSKVPAPVPAPQTSAASMSRVPPGCRPARSRTTGELKGYLTPDGEFVSLAAVEAVR